MSSKYDKVFEARGEAGGAKKGGVKKGDAKKSSTTKGAAVRKGAALASDGGGKSDAGGDGAEQRRRGRPYGKRSDPEYVGFTTYIRKSTHKQVKRALLDGDEDRELSELVEELLVEWLKSRG